MKKRSYKEFQSNYEPIIQIIERKKRKGGSLYRQKTKKEKRTERKKLGYIYQR